MPKGKGQFLKKANAEHEYDMDMALELKKSAESASYFITKYIRIQHPTRGNVPFELYPFQERLIQSFQTHRKNIVLASRQIGKSQCAAAYLLWYACFQFDKTVLIASNKEQAAMEIITRIAYMYEYLPDWLKPGIMPDQCNKHEIGFDNKSRIISTATSENSGRGLAISLLFCDEFGFINRSVGEKFWTSISPTLAQGGACIIASTPNGDTDIFSTLWRGAELGLNDFHPTWVKWNEPPGRDEKFKQEQIAEIGLQKWEQEYECRFISSDSLLMDSLFLSNLTSQMINQRPLHTQNDITFFMEIKEGEMYMVGVDPSEGGGNDFCTIEVFSISKLEQVIEFRSNTRSTTQAYVILKQIIKYIESKGGEVYFSIESNGIGQGIIATYEADEFPSESAYFISDNTSSSSKKGMFTEGRSKIRSCFLFKEMLESGRMKIHSQTLLKELKSYVQTKTSFKAQSGSTDDCISACLIVLRILEQLTKYDETAYNVMYNVKSNIKLNLHKMGQKDDDDDYDIDNDDDFMPVVM